MLVWRQGRIGGNFANLARSRNTILVSSGLTDRAMTFNGQRIIDSKDGGVMAHGTYSAPGKTFVLFETDQGPSGAMFQIVAVAGTRAFRQCRRQADDTSRL